MFHQKPIGHQVMVLTGASSGIGLVTARMAAKKDTKLVLAARNGFVAPRFTDLLMTKTQFKAHKSDQSSRGPDDNGLHHAGYGLQERAQPLGWMRSTSLYTKASMHPLATLVGLAGAGLLVVPLS